MGSKHSATKTGADPGFEKVGARPRKAAKNLNINDIHDPLI